MADGDNPNDNPNAGHRARLRERFLQTLGEGFADYELLELLLTLAIPRQDVKPLAKTLIARFRTFSGVIAASPVDLTAVDGVKGNTLTALKLVQAAALRLMKQEVIDQPLLNSWDRLLNYLAAAMKEEKNEQFRLLFLDKRNHLIADEIQQRGTVDHTPVYAREVIKRALELGATALILVHNHPSGDPTPSRADIEMTKELIRATAGVGITIHDHLIVGKSATSSFKSLGLL
jgi:DNA repair protein RadC